MICLSRLIDEVDGISCAQLFDSSDIHNGLQTCEFLTQFPTIPVFFGHVRFFYYKNNTNDLNIESFRPPDLICYDERLCNFLTPTYRFENNTCRSAHEIGFESNFTYINLITVMNAIKPFFRGCLTTLKEVSDFHHVSLYRYCFMNDDEDQVELSCSLNDTRRFKCFNKTECRLSFNGRHHCSPNEKPNPSQLNKILFFQICDRIQDLSFETINGYNYSDETECDYWQCNNIHTRCDSLWNCPNGEDEQNCTDTICPSYFHPCVSASNYTFTCLSADKVDDGTIDCLGASDEIHSCRIKKNDSAGFQCLNDNKCLSSHQLCNKFTDCPLGDDEIFCRNRQYVCLIIHQSKRTVEEKVLCPFVDTEKEIYFPFEALPTYPLSETRKILTLPPIQRVKHYHSPCQTRPDLMCFFDDFYMCLCTVERQADCFKFNPNVSLACKQESYCQNGAECIQDDPTCPSFTICVCIDCFFGDQCQFYAKGIGLTLDDILRYEIRLNTSFIHQPLSVKISAIMTMIMFSGGLINSVLSLLTFQSKRTRQVGCGIYLFASSLMSLLTVSIFTVKFWFVIFTQTNVFINLGSMHV
ncbi:hypothetical protein I4U23_005629 [Adineta vaga]|nr:hypothetical protein I4U23_005629 [Adineta vaga]